MILVLGGTRSVTTAESLADAEAAAHGPAVHVAGQGFLQRRLRHGCIYMGF